MEQDRACESIHPIVIRRERAADQTAIRKVVGDAFRDQAPPGAVPVEVGLVDALRTSDEWIPQLSLVADSNDESIVGYVVCTRGWVGDRPALGLGPLAVAPSGQRRGTGSALMHALLGAADALGEPLVLLLGHTTYYPRFGFRPASDLGVEAPQADWGPYFQARPLSAYVQQLRGTFRYAPPFDEL